MASVLCCNESWLWAEDEEKKDQCLRHKGQTTDSVQLTSPHWKRKTLWRHSNRAECTMFLKALPSKVKCQGIHHHTVRLKIFL